jgi:hypothetical protein
MKKTKENVVKFILPPREEIIELIKNSFNWFTFRGLEGILTASVYADDGLEFCAFDHLSDDQLHNIIEFDDLNPLNIGNFPREVVNHFGDKLIRQLREVYELAEPEENQDVFC